MLLSFKCGECAYQRSETFVSAAASKRQSPVLRVHRARARTRTGQAVCGPTSVSAASFGCRDKSRQGRRQRRRVIHPLAQTAGGRSPAQISRRPPASAAGAPDLRSHRPFLRPGPARPGRFGCWRPLRLDTRDSRATSNHSRLESDQQSLESDQQSATSDQRSLTRERSAISDQRPAVALTLERPAISDQQSLETRKRSDFRPCSDTRAALRGVPRPRRRAAPHSVPERGARSRCTVTLRSRCGAGHAAAHGHAAALRRRRHRAAGAARQLCTQPAPVPACVFGECLRENGARSEAPAAVAVAHGGGGGGGGGGSAAMQRRLVDPCPRQGFQARSNRATAPLPGHRPA